ncbi:MAG: hypothetical protein JEY79_19495 [Pseudodesulfovibrio sp.]|nr:hypothetical protein [Pseudodesulfovibrio sp.]
MKNVNIESNSKYSIVSIINWDTYQCEIKNGNSKGNNQGTTKEQPRNTNKNDKKEKTIKSFPDSGESGALFFLTKKKRKLTGKRLESFNRFWDAFGYKKGKAETADSWLDIPTLTEALVCQVCQAASVEDSNRPGLIASGRTPKMAQGWLTARRWEDEDLVGAVPKQKISTMEDFEIR